MLPSYRNILVAIDFSSNAEHVLKCAAALAHHADARIYQLHVLAPVDSNVLHSVTAMLGKEELQEIGHDKQEQARLALRQKLDRLVEQEMASHPGERGKFQEAIVDVGDPAAAILEHAKRIRADVIVVGTRGKGSIAQALLGSVADRVLQKAKTPVLMIPPATD